jgi:hypothetical protein
MIFVSPFSPLIAVTPIWGNVGKLSAVKMLRTDIKTECRLGKEGPGAQNTIRKTKTAGIQDCGGREEPGEWGHFHQLLREWR